MELKEQFFDKLAESYIEDAKATITEEERRRRSLPNFELTTLEIEFLYGIANGRSTEELNTAIKLCTKEEHTYYTMYTRLSKKFEAENLAHIIYKAMKLGFIA